RLDAPRCSRFQPIKHESNAKRLASRGRVTSRPPYCLFRRRIVGLLKGPARQGNDRNLAQFRFGLVDVLVLHEHGSCDATSFVGFYRLWESSALIDSFASTNMAYPHRSLRSLKGARSMFLLGLGVNEQGL